VPIPLDNATAAKLITHKYIKPMGMSVCPTTPAAHSKRPTGQRVCALSVVQAIFWGALGYAAMTHSAHHASMTLIKDAHTVTLGLVQYMVGAAYKSDAKHAHRTNRTVQYVNPDTLRLGMHVVYSPLAIPVTIHPAIATAA